MDEFKRPVTLADLVGLTEEEVKARVAVGTHVAVFKADVQAMHVVSVVIKNGIVVSAQAGLLKRAVE